MYHSRVQELMTQGYSLSNKLHFGEWNPDEFEAWIDNCQSLLSSCEPEPYFPWNPDPRHIEEIVMLLGETMSRISKGQTKYTGLL